MNDYERGKADERARVYKHLNLACDIGDDNEKFVLNGLRFMMAKDA